MCVCRTNIFNLLIPHTYVNACTFLLLSLLVYYHFKCTLGKLRIVTGACIYHYLHIKNSINSNNSNNNITVHWVSALTYKCQSCLVCNCSNSTQQWGGGYKLSVWGIVRIVGWYTIVVKNNFIHRCT